MHFHSDDAILKQADKLIARSGRSPKQILSDLNLTLIEAPFRKQKGAYKVIQRNRYIFLKEDLDPVMRDIVLLHEVGHDRLHRKYASQFQEFNLFDMNHNIMEYEANLFAAHILLPDEEVIEAVYNGMSASQIAGSMHSDINLVALKVGDLARRGYAFQPQDASNDFLKS